MVTLSNTDHKGLIFKLTEWFKEHQNIVISASLGLLLTLYVWYIRSKMSSGEERSEPKTIEDNNTGKITSDKCEPTSSSQSENDSESTDKIKENSESSQSSSDDQSLEDPEITMKKGIKVIIKCGNITRESVDVIVNAANGRLAHGGGVARAIAVGAGRGIDEEGQKKLKDRGSSLKVSEVLHTGGYNLNAEYVVHAVGPIRGRDDKFHSQLRSTFFNCLDYADQTLKAKSIAIPLISSGIFGGQKMECAKALVDALNSFVDDDKFNMLKEIRLVNIDHEATDALKKLAPTLKAIHQS